MLICHFSIFISLLAWYGGLVYWTWKLDTLGIIVSIILSVVSFAGWWWLGRMEKRKEKMGKSGSGILDLFEDPVDLALVLVYLSVVAYSVFLLISSQTTSALVSPWEVVPGIFFLVYGCATFLLIFISVRVKPVLAVSAVSLHSLLSFSVLAIVFRIGYGFDPFIHQASLRVIDSVGAIEPKTIYYLGQYAVEIITHRLTSIPLPLIDRFLVPLLAAVTLPSAFYRLSRLWFADRRAAGLTLSLLFILPLGAFTLTTPQAFAYLLALLSILSGLWSRSAADRLGTWILALASLITHPIAGIPAVCFAAAATMPLLPIARRYQTALAAATLLAVALGLPFLFRIIGAAVPADQNNVSGFDFPFPRLGSLPNSEPVILNIAYAIGWNLPLLFALLSVTGIWLSKRYARLRNELRLSLLFASACFIAYLLTALLPFGFLIDYERSDYALRLLTMAALFLIPFTVIALHSLALRLLCQRAPVRYPVILGLSIIAAASLYYAYPRRDHFHDSHSYAVSAADIAAVNWIADDAQGAPYIVLANQQVSAAALHEFGFKTYYDEIYQHKWPEQYANDPNIANGNKVFNDNKSEIENRKSKIFFYPIPTGGPLYRIYLDMVYDDPSAATARRAMDLAGVNRAYFVLNKYWWAFDKVANAAKLSADDWHAIDDGRILIFVYEGGWE